MRTDYVCVLVAQYLIILLQHLLQCRVILGIRFLEQALECHDSLVVVAESLGQPL